MPTETCIVWFRQDLRLQDNPALQQAIASGAQVVPVYIASPDEEGEWTPGGAAQWWLHHALADLDDQFHLQGGRLVLRQGPSLDTLLSLITETGARAVYWNRRYEPDAIQRDSQVKKALQEAGIEAMSANASLLNEPHTISNKQGEPFKVFTPYYKHCQTLPTMAPVKVDLEALSFPPKLPRSEALEALELLPRIRWDEGLRKAWDPTQAGAQALLTIFKKDLIGQYGTLRNRPDIEGTSRLSPYLHWGQIGPRQILDKVSELEGKGVPKYVAEVYWREFAYHILYHFPHTTSEPMRPEFHHFPWEDNDDLLRRWQKGQTGFPIVDAGMRELWETGWMHNRVRMNVASLLVKHLLLPWGRGAEWFWDTLVDADLASNTLGWQWAGGCGADAAPYFRIFNPILQGKKFDPNGDYVRRYVPELAKLPTDYIHAPWEAPELILQEAGVRLGKEYPYPVIKHEEGRARALKAFEALKAHKKSAA